MFRLPAKAYSGVMELFHTSQGRGNDTRSGPTGWALPRKGYTMNTSKALAVALSTGRVSLAATSQTTAEHKKAMHDGMKMMSGPGTSVDTTAASFLDHTHTLASK